MNIIMGIGLDTPIPTWLFVLLIPVAVIVGLGIANGLFRLVIKPVLDWLWGA